MRQWVLAVVAAMVLVGALWGCVNVKVPEGPYVSLTDDKPAKTDKAKVRDDVLDVLEDARDDGIITDVQYERLKERVEKEFR